MKFRKRFLLIPIFILPVLLSAVWFYNPDNQIKWAFYKTFRSPGADMPLTDWMTFLDQSKSDLHFDITLNRLDTPFLSREDSSVISLAEGISAKGDISYSLPAKTASGNITLSYLYKPYFDLQLYAKGDNLSARLKNYDSDNFEMGYYSIILSSIGNDFNNSTLSGLMNFQADEEITLDLFQEPISDFTHFTKDNEGTYFAKSVNSDATLNITLNDNNKIAVISLIPENDGHKSNYKLTLEGNNIILQQDIFRNGSLYSSLSVKGRYQKKTKDNQEGFQLSSVDYIHKESGLQCNLYGTVSVTPLTSQLSNPPKDASSFFHLDQETYKSLYDSYILPFLPVDH